MASAVVSSDDEVWSPVTVFLLDPLDPFSSYKPSA